MGGRERRGRRTRTKRVLDPGPGRRLGRGGVAGGGAGVVGGRRAGREGAGGWGGRGAGAAGSREGEACRTTKQRKRKIATKWLPD